MVKRKARVAYKRILALIMSMIMVMSITFQSEIILVKADDEVNSYEDGGDPNGPPPPPHQSMPLTVSINGFKVYDGNLENNKMAIPEGAKYEIEETRDGIAIKPAFDSYKNSDGTQALSLGYIEAAGDGDVAVYAGFMYTPEDRTDGGHVEVTVPVEISANTDGYSFVAYNKARFKIENGNFRSTAKLAGGVITDYFTINDLSKLTIGKSDAPVVTAFESPEKNSNCGVEFNGGQVEIYANKGFANYGLIWAQDEADVTVSLKGEGQQLLNNVDNVRVQTGGIFKFNSDNPINSGSTKFQAGYFMELGTILDIPSEGRFQDYVKIVECQVGDYSNQVGRYKYTVSEDRKNIVLQSATNTLWSLGYSFLPDSGDLYVEHGHFEISAGSGIRRSELETGGEFWFEQGTEVTFKLIPDPGYQYKKQTFAFNGNTSENVVKPTDDLGVYTFIMPSNPVHVSCVFEKASDTTNTADSKTVTNAVITMPTDNKMEGTAELTVKDAVLSNAQQTEFEKIAGDKDVAAVLDLSLNKVVNKIGADDSWKQPVTDLTSSMDVSLKLDENVADGSEYVVVRQHNGKVEALDTQFDDKTGTVSFKTNGYSTYAIYCKSPDIPTGYETEFKALAGQKMYIDEGMFDRTSLAEGEEIAGFYIKDKAEKKSASISKSGLLTPKKSGVIHVTAYTKVKENKKTIKKDIDTVEITIIMPEFKFTEKARYIGQTISANAFVTNFDIVSEDQEVIWKSSNKKVAEIDPETGDITVNKTGKTSISVTFINDDEKKVTKKATLKVQLPKLAKTAKMRVGQEKLLKVSKLVDENVQVIQWDSDSPEVAEVDANGKVTAKSQGEANITATIDGVELICKVKVKE